MKNGILNSGFSSVFLKPCTSFNQHYNIMKETFYFSHDYNTRSDIKITKLLAKHGMRGYGIFWTLIEDLYNNANALQTDYDCIAYALHEDVELVKNVIHDFGLFVFEDDKFGSMSVQRRLDERDAKSQKARESALYRWNQCERIANEVRTQSDSNAIKESKVKERIKKESKSLIDYHSDFNMELMTYIKEYGLDLISAFEAYWTEPNPQKTKMRFQMEKTWSMKARLETWKKRSEQFKPQLNGTKVDDSRVGGGSGLKAL